MYVGGRVLLGLQFGAYNDPFRVYPSLALAPEVLRFVSGDSCAVLFDFPCLLIGLACLRGA